MQANIANSFSSLREAEDFFDVTVAAVDSEQQLQAHKVILAASSGFFRSVFRGFATCYIIVNFLSSQGPC